MAQEADEVEVYQALADPTYRKAFDKVMTGNEAFFTEAEKQAAWRAKQAVGEIWGPAYPMPWELDPDRRHLPPPAGAERIKAQARRLDQPE